jgi:microcystin-dependent protein
MKCTFPLNEQKVSKTNQSPDSTAHRRLKGLAIGLLVLVLMGAMLGDEVRAQAGSEALFINKEGNVGVGTTEPKAKLDVKGAIAGIGVVPPGGIIMFSGDVTKAFDENGTGIKGTPYEGWQLCNGKNGSPDLRDRFVAGAGGNYSIGTQGGADRVTLTLDQMPSHNHGGRTGGQDLRLNYPGVFYNSKGVSTGILVSVQQPSPRYRPNLLTTRGQPDIVVVPRNHTHGIASQGGNQAHENRPPFYALAFIMRLSTSSE